MLEYTITKDLMVVLESHRLEYKDWFLKNYDTKWLQIELNGEHHYKRPKVFMLAGKKNNIKQVIPIEGSQGDDSCGMMLAIYPNEFCNSLMKMKGKNSFMGLARVGAFHTQRTCTLGGGKMDLYSASHNSIFLSLGRNGVLLERPRYKDEIRELKLTIIGEENVQNLEAVNDSVSF